MTDQSLMQILTFITPLILLVMSGLGTVAWFFIRNYFEGLAQSSKANVEAFGALKKQLTDQLKKIEQEISDIPKLVAAVRSINDRMEKFEADLEVALVAADSQKDLVKRIGVLEEHLKTAFRKVDEARAEVERFQLEQDAFGSLISDLRASIEALSDKQQQLKGV